MEGDFFRQRQMCGLSGRDPNRPFRGVQPVSAVSEVRRAYILGGRHQVWNIA